MTLVNFLFAGKNAPWTWPIINDHGGLSFGPKWFQQFILSKVEIWKIKNLSIINKSFTSTYHYDWFKRHYNQPRSTTGLHHVLEGSVLLKNVDYVVPPLHCPSQNIAYPVKRKRKQGFDLKPKLSDSHCQRDSASFQQWSCTECYFTAYILYI